MQTLLDRFDKKTPHYPNHARTLIDRLRDLQTGLQSAGKTLTVYQLDMPDGVSNAHRAELEIRIQKVNC